MPRTEVKAKKALGQHFLTDLKIAEDITLALEPGNTPNTLEIGPGMGVLTQFLLNRKDLNMVAVDIDRESIDYLHKNYMPHASKIVYGDFLKMNINELFSGEAFNIIGNLPYNISSQIFFKVIEYRDRIPQVVSMIQKEVAERIASKHGNKAYGILSVFLQCYYDIEYLFTVHENVFNPPPKVKSAVIRLKRNNRTELPCNEKFFFTVVKTGFNQRRKTLRNSLKSLLPEGFDSPYMSLRPEQLSVEDFIELTTQLESLKTV